MSLVGGPPQSPQDDARSLKFGYQLVEKISSSPQNGDLVKHGEGGGLASGLDERERPRPGS
jgi:hypothetical protein